MVTANASERRRVHIRLIRDGVQPGKPLEEPLRFGLQDSKGEVSPGSVQSGEVQTFDFVVEVKELEVKRMTEASQCSRGVCARASGRSFPLSQLEA
jgi:hypothetical protein